MMQQKRAFRYAAADGLQLLEMNYGLGGLSMIVLLPEKVDALAALEAKLTAENLKKWIAALQRQEVSVFLPRFGATAQFELSATLKSLGMTSAFEASTADFSGMTGGKDLFVSAVLHKAFVDVNETGTEAAAATGVIMAPTAIRIDPKPPVVFRADHPFVFLIRDNRNDSILFLGRLMTPK
jgi:serpin B